MYGSRPFFRLVLGVISVAVVLVVLTFQPGLIPTESGPFSDIPLNSPVVDLRSRGLTSLPAEIGEYTKTVHLRLDDNHLTGALPAEIRKMTDLELLSANNNQLTGIPAEIGQLKNLGELSLRGNSISSIPNELYELQQPIVIDLVGNPLSAEQIATLESKMPNAHVLF